MMAMKLTSPFRPAPDAGTPATLLREVQEAQADGLTARLSAAGFDDLPPGGPAVLAAIAVCGDAASDLTRLAGCSGDAAARTVEALVLHGYLTHPAGLAQRGQDVLAEIKVGVRSARWATFPFRPGDIVISTAAKHGTTWMQMICALLIFQTTDLPAPLWSLSPWLDELIVSRDEVYRQLAGQEHRRFIKTHLPLHELTIDPRATYIVVARHPLDAALSLYHQIGNLHPVRSQVGSAQQAAGPAGPHSPATPEHEWLLRWIDQDCPAIMDRLARAWACRGEPNVVFMHYEDLCADLAGEMRRLAARLAVTVPKAAWPGLVRSATFQQMQASADRLQPTGILKSNVAFFRQGTSGGYQELLTPAELATYHASMARIAPPDLLAWLHRGVRRN
jgi:aryl sulfotransferase